MPSRWARMFSCTYRPLYWLRRSCEAMKRLSASQLEEFEDAFKFFDKNGDGTVNREELVISMRQFGGNPTDKEIDAIMLGLDKDDSDSIDFEEFVTIMVNYLKDPEEEERELMEAFQVFDRNGDGVVSTSEIKQVLKSIGKKMSTKEIEEIMKKADVNCDGELNYEEFVKLMTSNSFGS